MLNHISDLRTLRLDLQLAMIVVITALVSLSMYVFMPDSFKNKPCGDCSGGYIIPATNLIQGKGLVDNNGVLTTARPPGSPIIIAGLLYVQRWLDMSQQKVFWMFNSLMIAFSAILLLMISQLIWENQDAVFVPYVWITYPFLLWFINQPYPEIPYFVASFFTVYMFLRSYRQSSRKYWVYGLIVGLLSAVGMMIKPVGMGIPVIVVLVVMILHRERSWQERIKFSSAIVCGVLVLVIPWSAFVYTNSGKVIFLTDSIVLRNSLINGVTFATRGEEYREKLTLHPRVVRFMETIELELKSTKDKILQEQTVPGSQLRGQVEVGQVLDVIIKVSLEDPLGALYLLGTKVVRSWYGTDSHKLENYAIGIQLVYISMISLSFVGIIKKSLVHKEVLFIVLALILYYWAMSVLFEPLVRYLIPALGVLLILLPGLWASRSRDSVTG